MEIPAALLAAFPPSLDLWLDRSRRLVDDAMLADIANADYGWMADEVMAELRPIRDRGAVPDRWPFDLGEALTLTHFSDPDSPEAPPWASGPTNLRGQQTRLFACAILLRGDAENCEDRGFSTETALARCLIDAKVAGEEFSEAAARHLSWRATRRRSDHAGSCVALGLLILAVRLRRGRLTDPDLGAIATWVIEQEAAGRERSPGHLVGASPTAFRLQADFWRPLFEELREEARSIRDEASRSNVELCALLLDQG